jgi:hypothetical protein
MENSGKSGNRRMETLKTNIIKLIIFIFTAIGVLLLLYATATTDRRTIKNKTEIILNIGEVDSNTGLAYHGIIENTICLSIIRKHSESLNIPAYFPKSEKILHFSGSTIEIIEVDFQKIKFKIIN